ncbi:MAG: AAA family ATPase, partial [Proteobacteria bacterium]|nr:AAA family ATPase [Pseudomonadota bacterium]
LPHNLLVAEQYLAHREPAIEGSNGNNHTFETIAFLRDFGLSAQMAHEMILFSPWNLKRCKPEWDAEELATLVHNVWEYPQNRPGCKRSALSRIFTLTDDPVPVEDYREWTKKEHGIFEASGQGDAAPTVGDNTPQQEQQVQADDDLFPAYLVGELDQIPDPVWLIQDVLPEVSLGMTYGETGSLKTFLELDKALWGAVGKPWAANDAHDLEGFKVTRKLRTVIVAGEGARGLKRRIAAWAKRHGIKTDDLPVLVIPVMPRFANDGDLKKLIRTIERKLPNPDYIIVDTAMWAAAGLNLNVPADSQVLLSSFKQVMLAFGCSLIFVHHIGKDKKRGHLGAENLIAGVDVSDCVELEEKGIGRRKIKIINRKMKDAELRETISMEAYPETLGTDEDGRKFGSLVLRRCHGPKNGKNGEDDPRLTAALKIIADTKGEDELVY